MEPYLMKGDDYYIYIEDSCDKNYEICKENLK